MTPKHVFLDGRRLAQQARTTLEAARIATAAGADFDPNNAFERTQHIGEGLTAFYVAVRAGDYKGERI